MVDHEVDGDQRIDLLRVGTQRRCGIAHGGQIDHGRNAGEVLHQHAGRAEGDLVFDLAFVLHPFGDRFDIGLGHRDAIFGAQQVFKQDLQSHRQFRNIPEAIF